MKNLLLTLCLLGSVYVNAQEHGGGRRLDIRTNTVCDMCEKTIETELIYEKGVKHVDVELATNTIHVDYDPKRTDPEKLRTAVTMLGYAADGKLPEQKAREALPACCQKEGCGLPVIEK